MIKFFILKFFIISSLLIGNIENQKLFIDGNQFYFNQNYFEAINNYEKIINKGFYHENLYFNLGNAYYQANKIGYAIWSYEKGLKINPINKDLKYNLKIANSKLIAKIIIPKQFFIFSLYSKIISYLSFSNWFSLTSILFCFVCLLIIFQRSYKLFKNIFLKNILRILYITLLIMVLVLFDISLNLSKINKGIIISETIKIYSAPSNKSNLIHSMNEGSKIRIIRLNDLWIEVEFLDGNTGWVLKANIKEL